MHKLPDMALRGLPPLSFSKPSSQPSRQCSEPLATTRKDSSASDADDPFSKDDSHHLKVHKHNAPSIPATTSRHDSARALEFSPLQLLNPKGHVAGKNSAALPIPSDSMVKKEPNISHASLAYTFDSAATESSNDEDQDAEPIQTGLGSMIERTHNVSERDFRPAKRIKVEHEPKDRDDSKAKSKFTGGAKGSELGEYVRNGRKEGAGTEGPPAAAQVVDLTEGKCILSAPGAFF